MDPKIRQALNNVLQDNAIPGRDDARIQSHFSTLETILSHANTLPKHKRQEVFSHTQFYLEQTLDRATRFLLSPKLSNQKVRRGLNDLRDHIYALQQEYLVPRKERVLIHHSEHTTNSPAHDLSAQSLTHIPYSVVTLPSQDSSALTALATHHRAHREKRYFVRPKKGASTHRWNIDLVGAPQCWKASTGHGIRVGVVDTGVDYTHTHLAARFEENKGYDFVHNTNDPMDDNGHGTHVAGSIAGKEVGVAPGATLYALKFLDEYGMGGEVDFLRAAEWAIDHELDILNGSFGSGYASAPEEAMCNTLRQHGVLFIAAAGNKGDTSYCYPASYDSVYSVAAVDRHKTHAWFSQANDQVRISAPGVDVYSTIPGGFAEFNGTSMATPHVAGAAALVYEPFMTPEYTQELLDMSAEDLGDARKFGRGLVRPDNALEITSFAERWKK